VIFANYDFGSGPWYEVNAPLDFTATQLGQPEPACPGWSPGMVTVANASTLLALDATVQDGSQCDVRYGEASMGALPYHDTFGNGTDSGWAAYSGDWVVSDGTYMDTAGGGDDLSLVGSTEWSDYQMTGEVKLANGGGDAGLVLRATDPNSGGNGFNGYYVALSPNNLLSLERNLTGTATVLTNTTTDANVIPGAWYQITAVVVGCQITASVAPDGGAAIGTFSYLDSGCTTTRLGQAGVRTRINAASFRDISVVPDLRREAELAKLTNVTVFNGSSASGGQYVGNLNDGTGSIEFDDVWAPYAGTYGLYVQYANGGSAATHNLAVNGTPSGVVSYAPTGGWSTFSSTIADVGLLAGDNTIVFTKGTNNANVDYISVLPRFEAEDAVGNDVTDYQSSSASNGVYVGDIQNADSSVTFTTVSVSASGSYGLRIRYANGGSGTATQTLTVNGISAGTVSYSPTGGATNFAYQTVSVNLDQGVNTIAFGYQSGAVSLDCLDLIDTGTDLNGDLALPFQDHLLGGTQAGWDAYGGTWTVGSGGVYNNTSGGSGEKVLTGLPSWTDYTLTGQIELAGSGDAGFLVRATNPAVGTDSLDGYYVGLSTSGSFFVGREGYSWTQLASTTASETISTATWYEVSVTVVGCVIVANLLTNYGVSLGSLNYTDAGCTTTRQGQMGLRVHNSGASFRLLSVVPVSRLEAERATLTNVTVFNAPNASNGQYVGNLNDNTGSIEFDNVWAPHAGTYGMYVEYANGGGQATQNVTVNGTSAGAVSYWPTATWTYFNWTVMDVNLNSGDNTIVFTKGTLNANLDYITILPRYEAENGVVIDAIQYSSSSASNGLFIGGINSPDSSVTFTGVVAPSAGTYYIRIRYANGLTSTSTHLLTVNGVAAGSVSYAPTGGWGEFGYQTAAVSLNAGLNTVSLGKGNGYAELDCIDLVTP
jgi:hypothetical protein